MAQDPTMIANSTEKIALKYRNTCNRRLARLGRKVTFGVVIAFVPCLSGAVGWVFDCKKIEFAAIR